MKRRIVGAMCGICISIGLVGSGQAQVPASNSGPNANGPMLESLFRDILSAQMQRDRQRMDSNLSPVDRSNTFPTAANSTVTTPAFSRPPGTIPTAPNTPTNSRGYYPDSNSLRSFQTAMDGYAQQAGYLTTRLQPLANSIVELRSLLPDLYRVKASADMLSTISRRAVSYAEVYNDYLDLDWRWRNLSYQLHQISGLDTTTQQTIRQIDAYGDQLVDLLGVEPQFDRQGMLEQMTIARAFMTTLIEDLRFEIPPSPEREAIINDGLQLQEQIRREGDFVRSARYDEIVPRYTQFVTSWRRFSARLFPYKQARLNRDIAHIRQCGEDIYRLLWMPAPLDRAYLGVIADSFDRELHGFLAAITVADLARLSSDQQQQALARSRDLDVSSKQLVDSIRSRATVPDMQTAFRRVSRDREQLFYLLGPTTSKEMADRRAMVDTYDLELRDLLQVPQAVDHSQAIQLAAALEGLANTLKDDIHRYGPYYQNNTFRNQAYQAVDTFARQCQQLNASLAQGANLNDLKNYGNALLTSWNSVTRVISATPGYGLDPNRFQRLDQTRQEIMPLMADLGTMFTF